MATNYYTKKFNSTTALATFLNFSTSPIESGTGYVSSEVLTAVTQSTYADWQDIDGSGGDLAGYVLLSAAIASDQYLAVGTPATGSTIPVTGHADLGTAGAPVNYRVYAASTGGSFTGTISNIYKLDHSSIILVWTKAAPLHF